MRSLVHGCQCSQGMVRSRSAALSSAATLVRAAARLQLRERAEHGINQAAIPHQRAGEGRHDRPRRCEDDRPLRRFGRGQSGAHSSPVLEGQALGSGCDHGSGPHRHAGLLPFRSPRPASKAPPALGRVARRPQRFPVCRARGRVSPAPKDRDPRRDRDRSSCSLRSRGSGPRVCGRILPRPFGQVPGIQPAGRPVVLLTPAGVECAWVDQRAVPSEGRRREPLRINV